MKEGGTLVPRSLFLNRTETIATQAINYAGLFFFFFFFSFQERRQYTASWRYSNTPIQRSDWYILVVYRLHS